MCAADPGGSAEFRVCGPEAAAALHLLTQRAFAGYGVLDPPSGALKETESDVRKDLERGGGVIGLLSEQVVAGLRFELQVGGLLVRRVAVDPLHQRRGMGTSLMRFTQEHARRMGCSHVVVGVRRALPDNRRFYERLGYRLVREHLRPSDSRVIWDELRLEL